MGGLQLRRIFALLLLIGLSKAGLVHRRNAKESISTLIGSEQSSARNLRKDQIPVVILIESDSKPELSVANLKTELPAIVEVTEKPIELELPQVPKEVEQKKLEVAENYEQKSAGNVAEISAQSQRRKDDSVNDNERTDELNVQAITELEVIKDQNLDNNAGLSQESFAIQTANSELETLAATSSQLESDNDLNALADNVNVPLNSDLERQAIQATPTQSSTPPNFVQQLIQNSPIGQFLSQLTGGQQQQQQNQQSDEPATPQPTIPGFLNPGSAITSAQQAVQSVVNSTTQAFQGLQHFATNLGSQFQNTFANLAGQQNQLSTADSTTTRPPGPIQAIVSSFIGANQNAEDSTAAPGPLQGIFGFFQGGNRPQVTTAPPKEEPVPNPNVDDKVEMQLQNDPIVDKPEEPESINEVRSSAEVNSLDSSLENVPAEELIVVNDDINQQEVFA